MQLCELDAVFGMKLDSWDGVSLAVYVEHIHRNDNSKELPKSSVSATLGWGEVGRRDVLRSRRRAKPNFRLEGWHPVPWTLLGMTLSLYF